MLQPHVRAFIQELNHKPTFNTRNSIQTDMHGGGRANQYVMSGNSGSYPSESERDFQAVGNFTPYVDVSTGGGVRSGKISRYKKGKKWTDYAVKTVKSGLDLGKTAKSLFGYGMEGGVKSGGINRYKKGKKWTNYAVDTASKGLSLAKSAKSLFGMGLEADVKKVVRRTKKMAKDPLVGEVMALAKKNPVVRKVVAKVVAKAKSVVGGGRAKRAEIVKRVMLEKGMKMIEASKFVKAHNLYTP